MKFLCEKSIGLVNFYADSSDSDSDSEENSLSKRDYTLLEDLNQNLINLFVQTVSGINKVTVLDKITSASSRF